jgi:hypothetical protein
MSSPDQQKARAWVQRRLDPDSLVFVLAGQSLFFGLTAIINPVVFALTSLRVGFPLELAPLAWGTFSIMLGVLLFALPPSRIKIVFVLISAGWWGFVFSTFIQTNQYQPLVAIGLAAWMVVVSLITAYRCWSWE